MTKHVKPTKEQLQKDIEASQKKLEDLEKERNPAPSPSPSAAPSPSPSAASPSPSAAPSPSPSPSSPAPSGSPSPSGAPSPSPSPSQSPKKKDEKKTSASAAEAIILNARNKKYDEAVAMAEQIKEPEDDVMVAEYGKTEWDEMTDAQKKLAKKAWVSDVKMQIVVNASKEGKAVTDWIVKVNTFLEDPKTLNKHPQLEGKQADFKSFSLKESRRGLDFETLVLAFIGEQSTKVPDKKKGEMFPKGGSGKHGKPAPKDDMLTAAQGRLLMKTDYKAYKAKLIAGKIKNE